MGGSWHDASVVIPLAPYWVGSMQLHALKAMTALHDSKQQDLMLASFLFGGADALSSVVEAAAVCTGSTRCMWL